MSKIDIAIVEVGPRDGLQIAKQVMPTAYKKRWIKKISSVCCRND